MFLFANGNSDRQDFVFEPEEISDPYPEEIFEPDNDLSINNIWMGVIEEDTFFK